MSQFSSLLTLLQKQLIRVGHAWNNTPIMWSAGGRTVGRICTACEQEQWKDILSTTIKKQMIIFDSRKKIASNWADEKWVTQKIQHILKWLEMRKQTSPSICLHYGNTFSLVTKDLALKLDLA